MISEIACDIKELVLATGYVNTHFEYCELIKNGEVTYPAQYVGGGNYEQVMNNDTNGNSYLRKNGDVSFSDPTGLAGKKVKACGSSSFVKITIPLRLVMIVLKSKLGDNAFSDDKLALDMNNYLSSAVTTTIFGVQSLSYNVTGHDTDSISIWSQEVKGMEYQMNFNYSYVAINFNVEAIVNPSCLTEDCSPY
jgi:hypothetical protein